MWGLIALMKLARVCEFCGTESTTFINTLKLWRKKMAEKIFNYVAPICVIPPQQILAGRVNELRKKIARTRKKESKKLLEDELLVAEAALHRVLMELGR